MEYKNAPIHPFLRLIYRVLRALTRLMLRVFFRRQVLIGAENLHFDGPAIVIVNHPGTLMDVLAPGIHIRQEMYFLANYGLFKHPVSNWFFSRLFCIPVIRKEDVGEGVARNNDAAFEKSFQHLEKNGVLFIAPEGVSWMNRIVRTFKTGTARIACGAEARNNWALDVKIIPFGLTYSAPHLFRSYVVVQAGAPVYARDWKEHWEKDPETAAEALTLHLQERIKGLCIHTPDEAADLYIGQLETIANHEHPLPLREAFFRARRLAAQYLEDAEMREKTAHYFESLNRAGLDDAGLQAWAGPRAGRRTFAEAFALIFGLPFFAVGYLFWFLPCFIPWLINNRMKLYIGYSSAVKILSALIVFPVYFGWAYGRLSALLPEGWMALAALVVLLVLGRVTELYADLARRFWSRWKVIAAAANNKALAQQLLHQRQAIAEKIFQVPAQ